MERLTEIKPVWIDDETWCRAREPDEDEIDAVYLRLKQYEDTGLTPEQCAEYARADAEGRLVVLPCKVGDHVYDITDGTAYRTEVLSFAIRADGMACRTVSSYPNVDAFGTRIFLTREEAKEALTKGGDMHDQATEMD